MSSRGARAAKRSGGGDDDADDGGGGGPPAKRAAGATGAPAYTFSFGEDSYDDEDEREDDEDDGDGDHSFISEAVGSMRDAKGTEVASCHAYMLHRGLGDFDDIADEADGRDGELFDAVNALLSRAGTLDRCVLTGVWKDFRDTGGDLLYVDRLVVAPAHRGARLGHRLLDALYARHACQLAVVLPGILREDANADNAAREAALRAQLRYFQTAGFRRLGRTAYLARASDPGHACHTAPVEDFFDEAFGDAAGAAATHAQDIVAEEQARAAAEGLTGEKLLFTWRTRARARELAGLPAAEREREAAEVARIRARYPALCARSEADGEPVFMLTRGPPEWALAAMDEAARKRGFK